MDKTFSYDMMNVYNAIRSPSTVHVKNARLTRYFRKYLLQKAISVFKWKLPENWDRDYFLYTLYGMGFISVFYYPRYGVICQNCSPGGYNLYYRPSYVIVTNPLIKETLTLDIDKDCVLLKLQPDYSSIMDIVSYYADQLALCAEAFGANMINIKENEKLNMLNHSCAHLLAHAVKHLYPNAKFWVGPVIEEGFYYDIDLGDEVIKEEDLEKIEKEMKKISKSDKLIKRIELSILFLYNKNVM